MFRSLKKQNALNEIAIFNLFGALKSKELLKHLRFFNDLRQQNHLNTTPGPSFPYSWVQFYGTFRELSKTCPKFRREIAIFSRNLADIPSENQEHTTNKYKIWTNKIQISHKKRKTNTFFLAEIDSKCTLNFTKQVLKRNGRVPTQLIRPLSSALMGLIRPLRA